VEESRLACALVVVLRKELAAAEAAERLEAQLVAGRTQLATVPVRVLSQIRSPAHWPGLSVLTKVRSAAA